ncbi:TldD/PmbA family protein [Pseudomonas bohemica]|uniref:TldD/PmbA family protein n=1 Tax=Pseudomonas bohemica TaxID=2044872 RepID=UPI0018FEE76A|nr:metallopeptidase TldD-related protein [Pseudomonas bohemica]
MSTSLEQAPAQLAAAAEQLLDYARQSGASDAQVLLSSGHGLSLNLRQGRLRARRAEGHNSVSLTVYRGQRQGTTHSTDFSAASLADMARAACDIAAHTAQDHCAGLPDASLMTQAPLDLQLHHPWAVSAEEAQALAARIEQGISDQGPQVQSDGAFVSAYEACSFLANSRGFAHGYAQSSHALSANALASDGQRRHLSHWRSHERYSERLQMPEQIGARAASKALAYLDEQPLCTGRYRVLFDPDMAISLLMDFANAASGRALYTHGSYLRDRLGSQVMAEHLSLSEDPFQLAGLGSAPFDSDGLSGQRRRVVEHGQLQGYFLSTYSGRRLGLPSTGNANGPYNLSLHSQLTRDSDDWPAMLAQLDRGLLVAELAGEGTHLINGDYSRSAKGFWVENGVITHAVTGITIAGNLNSLLGDILAVGNDVVTRGHFSSGSVLIAHMQIGGR